MWLCPLKLPPWGFAAVQPDTVLIHTRVSAVNETPSSSSSSNGSSGYGGSGYGEGGSGEGGEGGEVIGSFVDSLCVRIASLDNMLPGSGFAIHSQMFRWERPIVARTKGRLGQAKQCRLQ